jgi:hypothetical protein
VALHPKPFLFRVYSRWGFGFLAGFGFRVSGVWFRISGVGFRVLSFGFRFPGNREEALKALGDVALHVPRLEHNMTPCGRGLRLRV